MLRRSAVAWDPGSLSARHCVSLQLAGWLEERAAAGGGGAWDGSLDLWRITRPLYAVQASEGVHATARTNAHLATATCNRDGDRPMRCPKYLFNMFKGSCNRITYGIFELLDAKHAKS